jgi:hypothetical protein
MRHAKAEIDKQRRPVGKDDVLLRIEFELAFDSVPKHSLTLHANLLVKYSEVSRSLI